MASTSRMCYLRDMENCIKKILPHEETIFIGRDFVASGRDKRVSRQQISATADTSTCKVTVRSVGAAASGCNGFALGKGDTYVLRHGDIIELLVGHYEYEVCFDPPPNDSPPSSSVPTKKFKEDTTADPIQETSVWETVDDKQLLIYTPASVIHRPKIAAFDMDATLIKTKSGNRFAKDEADWELNFSNIIDKLKEAYDKSYKLVIFTNKAGLGNRERSVGLFKTKMENIVTKIDLPIQVFAATGHTKYRKPAPGMWTTLCDYANGSVSVDVDESFYVGDAAGRAKNWAPKKNKDHSMADILFALNVGLKFYTPEEYFLGAGSVPHANPEFDPRTLAIPDFQVPLQDHPEVIILVGSPGSGKSFFCNTHLIPKGYAHVHRDMLSSLQCCVQKLEEYLKLKRSAVIDNTNPDKKSRKRYIDVARKHDLPCRCFIMNTPYRHAKHNNKFRELTDEFHNRVGEYIINSYKRKYDPPTLEEGFAEIVTIPFVPKFDNEEMEKFYKMFLLPD